jgi:tRNA U34 2-thiouridine synthase MnmA/TrmU
MAKAVALLSGGLDSTLAVKVILDQGIEVHALNFISAFCTCNSRGKQKGGPEGGCRSEAKRVAEEFGIPIKVIAKGLDYIEIVRNPKYGHGKGINPCMDCRIYMFKGAKKYMEEIGASFIITGEVLGQRPMSQRRDCFGIVEKESAMEGLILRPLSAKSLEPTMPEKTGLVDRHRLLSIVGRSRKPQIELADDLHIQDYPCPSGGCLLTDKIFSRKVKDLLDHKHTVTTTDLHALKTGRHFRYSGVKVIVGRDEKENIKLTKLIQPGDTVVEPVGFPGPVALVCGGMENGVHGFVGGLILRYASSKACGRGLLRATFNGVTCEFEAREAAGKPLDDETIKEFRVC